MARSQCGLKVIKYRLIKEILTTLNDWLFLLNCKLCKNAFEKVWSLNFSMKCPDFTLSHFLLYLGIFNLHFSNIALQLDMRGKQLSFFGITTYQGRKNLKIYWVWDFLFSHLFTSIWWFSRYIFRYDTVLWTGKGWFALQKWPFYCIDLP